MFRVLLAFTLFFASIAAIIFTVADAPVVPAGTSAEVEAKLNEFAGAGNWKNPSLGSPIVDAAGRTHLPVTFDHLELGRPCSVWVVFKSGHDPRVLEHTQWVSEYWTEILSGDRGEP